jgi:hypothetical protein
MLDDRAEVLPLELLNRVDWISHRAANPNKVWSIVPPIPPACQCASADLPPSGYLFLGEVHAHVTLPLLKGGIARRVAIRSPCSLLSG